MPFIKRKTYRINSTRLQSWEYANEGMYFITICTKNMNRYFGHVNHGEMHLSELGTIAESEWIKTPGLRPDMNIELGEYIIMPNHVHGIIMIGHNEYNNVNIRCRDALLGVSEVICQNPELNPNAGASQKSYNVQKIHSNDRKTTSNPIFKDAMHDVSTDTFQNSNPISENKPLNSKFAPQSKNIGSIIRGYKSAVTTYARKNNIPFEWQPRFHDRIIRDLKSYRKISEYILSNPEKWGNDPYTGITLEQ